MKRLLIFLSLIIAINKLTGQEKHASFINEYSISGNYTMLDDLSSIDEPGIGIGIFHVHDFSKNLALVIGLEYNLTRFSTGKKSSKYEQLIDALYSLNYISIPLMLRLSFGNKYKLLLEGGAYYENYLYASVKGTHITYGFMAMSSDTSKYYKNKLTRLINYGFMANLGIQFPLAGKKLLIKPGFVYGLENNNISSEFDHEYKLFNRYAKLSVILKL